MLKEVQVANKKQKLKNQKTILVIYLDQEIVIVGMVLVKAVVEVWEQVMVQELEEELVMGQEEVL